MVSGQVVTITEWSLTWSFLTALTMMEMPLMAVWLPRFTSSAVRMWHRSDRLLGLNLTCGYKCGNLVMLTIVVMFLFLFLLLLIHTNLVLACHADEVVALGDHLTEDLRGPGLGVRAQVSQPGHKTLLTILSNITIVLPPGHQRRQVAQAVGGGVQAAQHPVQLPGVTLQNLGKMGNMRSSE